MSVICNNCNSQNADGVKFCTSCGAPLERQAQEPPRQSAAYQQTSYQNSAAAQPNADYRIPINDREKVMGLGAWLLTFLLMLIPIVNIILLIKWAVSGKVNKNKQNMARAAVIYTVVFIVLFIVLGAVITPLITDFFYNTLALETGLPLGELEDLREAFQQFQDMGINLDAEQLQQLQQLSPEQLEELGITENQ